MTKLDLFKTLSVWPLLSALGCAPDFSPDAFNQAPVDAAVAPRPTRQTGSDAGAMSDASDLPYVSDAGELDVPPLDDGATPIPGGDEPATDDGCNLSGRYLMTERMVTNALGAKQTIYNWYYIELSQRGSQVTFSRSLVCGGNVAGQQPFIVSMDDGKAWPSYMTHPSYEGRHGTSMASGTGCAIAFEKAAVLRGATFETYRDLSVSLPTADQPADAANPGWEDWDGDGKPGVTMVVTGTITGTLYAATRTWTQYTGSIALHADHFTLPMLWQSDRSTLGYDGSPLLATDAARDSDLTQHLTELARLSDDQLTGDDASKCEAVRALAPMLTPNAMK